MKRIKFVRSVSLPLRGADGRWHRAWRVGTRQSPDAQEGVYNTGEVAGLPDDKADALVAAGHAIEVEGGAA